MFIILTCKVMSFKIAKGWQGVKASDQYNIAPSHMFISFKINNEIP